MPPLLHRTETPAPPDGRRSQTNADGPGEVRAMTFGCRLNTLETEVMQARAREAGLENTVLVNTCAVTGEAVRQARQAIRKARRDAPGARIVVSGCAAQIDPKAFSEMPEVDAVVGNDEKLTVDGYRHLARRDGNMSANVRVGDIMQAREAPDYQVSRLTGRARAFVQVQNGCDHRCTFCIIPYGRGNSRSVAPDAVVAQVRRLVENGYLEVVLTGVDLTSYGADIDGALPGGGRLGALVQRILREVPELPRLRLSSIDSIEADAELMAAIAEEERLMPHLHLSLQAGHDLTLKRMKRRHLSIDAERFCADARRLRPDIVFGADFIAGFPTETDEMFQATLDHVDACGLTHLHVFPFSPRPGTPAARMPQVDRGVTKERAARLREKGDERLLDHLNQEQGRIRDVLVEKPGFARTEHFTPVRMDGLSAGTIERVVIVGHSGNQLRARPHGRLADNA